MLEGIDGFSEQPFEGLPPVMVSMKQIQLVASIQASFEEMDRTMGLFRAPVAFIRPVFYYPNLEPGFLASLAAMTQRIAEFIKEKIFGQERPLGPPTFDGPGRANAVGLYATFLDQERVALLIEGAKTHFDTTDDVEALERVIQLTKEKVLNEVGYTLD